MKIYSSLNIAYEHSINNVMHPNQHLFNINSSDKNKMILRLEVSWQDYEKHTSNVS